MNYVAAFAQALRRHGITPGGGRADFTGIGELAELATTFLNSLPTEVKPLGKLFEEEEATAKAAADEAVKIKAATEAVIKPKKKATAKK